MRSFLVKAQVRPAGGLRAPGGRERSGSPRPTTPGLLATRLLALSQRDLVLVDPFEGVVALKLPLDAVRAVEVGNCAGSVWEEDERLALRVSLEVSADVIVAKRWRSQAMELVALPRYDMDLDAILLALFSSTRTTTSLGTLSKEGQGVVQRLRLDKEWDLLSLDTLDVFDQECFSDLAGQSGPQPRFSAPDPDDLALGLSNTHLCVVRRLRNGDSSRGDGPGGNLDSGENGNDSDAGFILLFKYRYALVMRFFVADPAHVLLQLQGGRILRLGCFRKQLDWIGLQATILGRIVLDQMTLGQDSLAAPYGIFDAKSAGELSRLSQLASKTFAASPRRFVASSRPVNNEAPAPGPDRSAIHLAHSAATAADAASLVDAAALNAQEVLAKAEKLLSQARSPRSVPSARSEDIVSDAGSSAEEGRPDEVHTLGIEIDHSKPAFPGRERPRTGPPLGRSMSDARQGSKSGLRRPSTASCRQQ